MSVASVTLITVVILQRAQVHSSYHLYKQISCSLLNKAVKHTFTRLRAVQMLHLKIAWKTPAVLLSPFHPRCLEGCTSVVPAGTKQPQQLLYFKFLNGG